MNKKILSIIFIFTSVALFADAKSDFEKAFEQYRKIHEDFIIGIESVQKDIIDKKILKELELEKDVLKICFDKLRDQYNYLRGYIDSQKGLSTWEFEEEKEILKLREDRYKDQLEKIKKITDKIKR